VIQICLRASFFLLFFSLDLLAGMGFNKDKPFFLFDGYLPVNLFHLYQNGVIQKGIL
jgi:hypothetical protein